MLDPHFVAGQVILTNMGRPEVSPPAHYKDKEGQEARLLQLQEDMALVHEEIGMAPRSQPNSRSGSRMTSLSNSVQNSPSLDPMEKESLNVVPVVLTPSAAMALLTDEERTWTSPTAIGRGEIQMSGTILSSLEASPRSRAMRKTSLVPEPMGETDFPEPLTPIDLSTRNYGLLEPTSPRNPFRGVRGKEGLDALDIQGLTG